MSWKPIDLAPRDGTPIVVAFRSPLSGSVSAFVARWALGEWLRQASGGETETAGEVAFAWTALPDEGL